MPKLNVILDQIDSGVMLLPEFQRGYVWNRDQVRGLMLSLYRGFPVGSLLVWETSADGTSVRGGFAGGGVRQLLLDGQQRITSLYGVVRGQPPAFFEGDQKSFTGLRFNVEDETFEFYAAAKMRDDPRWVDVTQLFKEGLQPFIAAFAADPASMAVYLTRLSRLHDLLQRSFHAEVITGQDKTVDVVVDIFNRVNSGGTKLSKGDLALAKICAEWADARGEMRDVLAKWQDAGYSFTLDWLLRNINAVATGRAQFQALDGVSSDAFRAALQSAAKYVASFLDLVAGRLGLDHDRVLMGRYAIPVVSRYLHLNGGKFASSAEQDRLLFWYIHSALWGRFTGSVETLLTQDFDTAQRSGIDGLIESLSRWRGGNLSIEPHDFSGATMGSRFYPLLYLLTRARGARDLCSGLELRASLLGYLSSLQVHHIFPKALLYKAGYERGEVNAVANFCLLTQKCNLEIGRQHPSEYLPKYEAIYPGVLASQWIPTDPDLWRVDQYRDFLDARRELLAAAANEFLGVLRSGTSTPAPPLPRAIVVVADEEPDPRDEEVSRLVEALVAAGYVAPLRDAEISDPETGAVLAIAEAFWPDGLQPGLGAPVVLELDPHQADRARLEELGYEIFTAVEALERHAARRSEVAAGLRTEQQE